MLKEITLCGTKIQYNMHYKNVKNINIRIKSDGSVHVSANKLTSSAVIEAFMQAKAHNILNAINTYKSVVNEKPTEYFTEDELKREIMHFCETIYPYYERLGIKMPKIKFRKMVSMWGSCNKTKGIVTFNTNLKFSPVECVRYVIWHEFTHLIVPNHSKEFYAELEKVCPDWKTCRRIMKKIHLKK